MLKAKRRLNYAKLG